MICESTGEVCLYATLVQNMHERSVFAGSVEQNPVSEPFDNAAGEVLKEVLNSPMECDDKFCKILAYGLAKSLMSMAILKAEHRTRLGKNST